MGATNRLTAGRGAFIDYGLRSHVAGSGSLASVPPDGPHFDLADIYHRLSRSGLLAGYEVHERFYEIGSHQGLAEAADYFKGREH